MQYIRDIVAVELMELARTESPLWFYTFEEIHGLTARP
jgi:hypothetical protein